MLKPVDPLLAFVVEGPLKAVQDSREVGHADTDQPFQKGVRDRTGQEGLPGPDVAIEQNPDVPGEAVEACIYPDPEVMKGVPEPEVRKRLESIISSVNRNLESFQKIERLTVLSSPMEETTTRKIKRGKIAASGS